MTRREALIALRGAVEASGDFIGHLSSKAFDPERHVLALRAYGEMQPRGSLDDAIALAEQSLPGWVWAVGCRGPEDGQDSPYAVIAHDKNDLKHQFDASAPTPARALLLAILEALIAKEGKG